MGEPDDDDDEDEEDSDFYIKPEEIEEEESDEEDYDEEELEITEDEVHAVLQEMDEMETPPKSEGNFCGGFLDKLLPFLCIIGFQEE